MIGKGECERSLSSAALAIRPAAAPGDANLTNSFDAKRILVRVRLLNQRSLVEQRRLGGKLGLGIRLGSCSSSGLTGISAPPVDAVKRDATDR